MKRPNPAQLVLPLCECLTQKLMSSLLLVTAGNVMFVAKCYLFGGQPGFDTEWLYTEEIAIIGRSLCLERLRQENSLFWSSLVCGTTYAKRCNANAKDGIMPLLSKYTLTVLGSLTSISSRSKRLPKELRTEPHMRVLVTWQLSN